MIASLMLYHLLGKKNVEKASETPKVSEPVPDRQPQFETDSDSVPAPTITLEEDLTMPPAPFKVPSPPPKDSVKEQTGLPPQQRNEEVPLFKTPEPRQMSNPPAPQETPVVIRSSSPPRLKPPTFGSAPAPPRPGNGLIRPPPSSAASLRVPPTKVLPNAAMAPTSSIMPPGRQVSRKVVLEPGHSPLDWAALTSSPNSRLRGKDAPQNLVRVTPSQLKVQNGRKGRDAWTTYQGKVYNITPYVPFHPGGAGEILRGAGKDSTKLFAETHPWVNWDGMLAECLVGILVSEEEARDTNNAGSLDEMD